MTESISWAPQMFVESRPRSVTPSTHSSPPFQKEKETAAVINVLPSPFPSHLHSKSRKTAAVYDRPPYGGSAARLLIRGGEKATHSPFPWTSVH